MIDIDYSFLRLRDNLADAINLGESPADDLTYVGQIQLLPTETYLQISNSPTAINLSSWEAHLVDACGTVLTEITNNIFITNFTDTNGRAQIAWEFINRFEYHSRPVSIRFTETSNGDTWFTNLFVSTADDSELTVRFDYKNSGYHYGTQYERAPYYQSIRLNGFYNNRVNSSERAEYHQITTDITVPQRNVRIIKERYVFDYLSDWHSLRLETLLSSNEIYADNVRKYSTEPLEFVEGELDSNISQHEALLNPNYEGTFTFDYQIFEGFNLVSTYTEDNGVYTPANVDADLIMTFNVDAEILTGTLEIINTLTSVVVVTYTESDMSVTDNVITIEDVFGTGNDVTANGIYHVNISSGLLQSDGTEIAYPGISDITTWNFTFLNGQYEGTDYNNDDYLTD